MSGKHGGNDQWTVKLDSVGNLEWQKCFGGSNEDYSFIVYQTSDSGYISAGYTASRDGDINDNHGGWDIMMVKLKKDGTDSAIQYPISEDHLVVAPNLFSNESHITLSVPEAASISLNIIDVLGKNSGFHLNQFFEAGLHQVSVSPRLSPGIYFLDVRNDKTRFINKIIVQ